MARLWLGCVSDPGWRELPEYPPPRHERSVRGLLGRVGEQGFKLMLRQLFAWAGNVRHADGFLDFASRRCAIDHGAYAEIVYGSAQWSGRSGRELATLKERPALAPNPLWLFDLLHGVSEASEAGSEPVRGAPCRRLTARSDLHRLSERLPDDTPLPPGASFEALRALPFEVWIDDAALVRRIRYEQRVLGDASAAYTLELLDFGTKAALAKTLIFKGTESTPFALNADASATQIGHANQGTGSAPLAHSRHSARPSMTPATAASTPAGRRRAPRGADRCSPPAAYLVPSFTRPWRSPRAEPPRSRRPPFPGRRGLRA